MRLFGKRDPEIAAGSAAAARSVRGPPARPDRPRRSAAHRASRGVGARPCLSPRRPARVQPRSSVQHGELGRAMPILEAVELAARRAGVPVDARIERGTLADRRSRTALGYRVVRPRRHPRACAGPDRLLHEGPLVDARARPGRDPRASACAQRRRVRERRGAVIHLRVVAPHDGPGGIPNACGALQGAHAGNAGCDPSPAPNSIPWPGLVRSVCAESERSPGKPTCRMASCQLGSAVVSTKSTFADRRSNDRGPATRPRTRLDRTSPRSLLSPQGGQRDSLSHILPSRDLERQVLVRIRWWVSRRLAPRSW